MSLVKNKLIDRLIKASGNEFADTVQSSEVIHNKDFITTPIPALNIALSGEVDGGLGSGVMQIVGESKSFKTLFCLILAKAYLDKYPEAVVVFFDSEHGAAFEYFESVGIDVNRVGHFPITSVEDLRIQFSKITKESTRGEKVFYMVDSVGLLASDKEITDAEDGKTTADMTRARALNSFFRIAVSKIPLLDVPMVVVNHSYDQIGTMYPQKIVKGGKGGYLASNYIWMISRSQEKTGTGLVGYNFTIGIEKSRKVIEKSKIPITVTFAGGIEKYSGILDLAVESGHIEKPSNGWYQLKGTDQKVREKDTDPLLQKVVADPTFNEFIKKKYQLAATDLMQNFDVETFDDVIQEEQE